MCAAFASLAVGVAFAQQFSVSASSPPGRRAVRWRAAASNTWQHAVKLQRSHRLHAHDLASLRIANSGGKYGNMVLHGAELVQSRELRATVTGRRDRLRRQFLRCRKNEKLMRKKMP
jgi:hypothetical protein